MSEIHHAILETIRETDDPEVTFSLLAEYAAEQMRADWEDFLTRNEGRDADEETVEMWLKEGAFGSIRSVVSSFDSDVQIRALDGEFSERGYDVLTSSPNDLAHEIQCELEVAIRDEAAFRLTSRNHLPDNGFGERLNVPEYTPKRDEP